MGKVIWTEEAECWLAEIRAYIAADNPTAAERTADGIFEKSLMLERFPEIGSRRRHALGEFRILMYGHYRITYHVRHDGDVVILGVFHGALDIQRYL